MENKIKKELMEPIAKRQRRSDEVLERIKDLIISQQLCPGDKLPSEKALSEIFQVSRISIREAVQRLSILGFLDIRQGDGMYVREADLSYYFKWIQESLELLIGVNHQTFLEVFRVRTALETLTATEAAKNATDEDIALLEAAFNDMEAYTNDARKYSEKDLKFHNVIAYCAHNIVLYYLLKLIHSLIKKTHQELLKIPQTLEHSQPVHRDIFEAIKNRSEKDAAEAMAKHIRKAEDYFTGSLIKEAANNC